jgi:hypothetical protein
VGLVVTVKPEAVEAFVELTRSIVIATLTVLPPINPDTVVALVDEAAFTDARAIDV